MARRRPSQVDILNNTSFLDALFILIGALVFMLLLVALVTEGLRLGYFDLELPYADDAELPAGVVGREYDMAVGAYGGNERYTCELVSGELPPGLRFTTEASASSPLEGVCRIQGVPTAGTDEPATFELRVDDQPVLVPETGETLDKQAITRRFSLSVIDPSESSPLTVMMDALPAAIRNTEYRLFLAAEGGVAPYNWSMTGELPEGLSLRSAGIVTGTPAGLATSKVAFTVTDGSGASQGTGPLSLSVAREFPEDLIVPPLRIETKALPHATVGAAYVLYLSASGGIAPYEWSPLAPMPDGLECCQGGAIDGTPQVDGEQAVRFQVKSATSLDGGAERVEAQLTLVVKPPPPKPLPLRMFPAAGAP